MKWKKYFICNSWIPLLFQFEGQNLEGSMDLLLKGYGGVPVKEMASPVDVSRMLSRMVSLNNVKNMSRDT